MSFSEDSDSNASSRNASEAMESDNEGDFGAVGRPAEPYRFEPDAPEDYQEPNEEDDEDGFTATILEARSENQITIDKSSGQVNLVSSRLTLHNFFALPTVCYLTVLNYSNLSSFVRIQV